MKCMCNDTKFLLVVYMRVRGYSTDHRYVIIIRKLEDSLLYKSLSKNLKLLNWENTIGNCSLLINVLTRKCLLDRIKI